ASVLKRLPEPRRQGYFSVWPEVIHSFADKVGQEPKPMRVIRSRAAFSRMEETLSWTVGLSPIDVTIVWLGAGGECWTTIAWTFGWQRPAEHEHWIYARCVIAFRLNGGRLTRNLSKRKVISIARAARP